MRLSDSTQLRSQPLSKFSRPVLIAVTLALMAMVALADFALVDFDAISHLYYLPILLAATQLGRRYALVLAGMAIVLVHLADPELSHLRYGEADIMELVLFMTVAVVASRLSERTRELRHLASTDDLTGLHNLRSFESLGRALIDRQRLAKGSVAMLSLDVDHLKRLNDTYGHLTGADAVKHIGHIIARAVPSDGYACRYGGDEFVIIVPESGGPEVSVLSRRIKELVEAAAPVLDTRAFPAGTLSVSIGSASDVIEAEHATSGVFTELFRRADEAMYREKPPGAPRSPTRARPSPAALRCWSALSQEIASLAPPAAAQPAWARIHGD